MEFAAARKFLSDRLNMPTEMTSRVISEEIPLQVRAHCFFSARVAESHVLERLRGISDAYGNGEMDLATAREKFKRWYDQEKPGQRDEDGEGMQNIASTMRLNLVFRQNAAMAAAVGRYQVGRDPAIEERWPCWRYVTGSNPRDAHAALDGRVFLKSDPIWQKIYPPWEFNCNCDVEDAELPEGGADKIEPGAVPPAKSGYAFDPAEAFKTFDVSQFDVGPDRETVHDQLVHFCTKNNATAIVVAKDSPEGALLAGVAEPSPARKKEISQRIDQIIARIKKDENGKLDVSDVLSETIDLGSMLEIHRQALGIGYKESRISFQIPGTRDYGLKHWLKHHKDTLDGQTVITLLEKTIWNTGVVPHEDIKGSKRRIVFATQEGGNAQTVLFELTRIGKSHQWQLVDSWKPSDEYLDRQKK